MWSPRLVLLVLCVTVVFPVLAAGAQESFEDKNRFCPLVSPELAAAIADDIKGEGRCEVRCSGCGCKGGPGFRETSSEQCVSWKDLISKCGPPPHSLCTAECEPVKPNCPGRAWIKEVARDAKLAVQFIEGKERPQKQKKSKKKLDNQSEPPPSSLQDDASTFACAGKKTCKEMSSCAEAKFYLAKCGASHLDGDGDGRPCNKLCP
jgi:hypothetical protein